MVSDIILCGISAISCFIVLADPESFDMKHLLGCHLQTWTLTWGVCCSSWAKMVLSVRVFRSYLIESTEEGVHVARSVIVIAMEILGLYLWAFLVTIILALHESNSIQTRSCTLTATTEDPTTPRILQHTPENLLVSTKWSRRMLPKRGPDR